MMQMSDYFPAPAITEPLLGMEVKVAGDAASSQTVQFAADHTEYVPSCEQHPITDGGGLSSTADWRCPQVKEDLLKPLRKRLEARVVELGLVPRLVKRISGSEKVCVLGTGCKGELLLSPFYTSISCSYRKRLIATLIQRRSLPLRQYACI